MLIRHLLPGNPSVSVQLAARIAGKNRKTKPALILTFCFLFPMLGCGATPLKTYRSESPAAPSVRNQAQPGEPVKEIPYRVDGVTYFPLETAEGYEEEGIASWYGPKFHGKLTSNKEVYNMHSMTAAHKTLPFNTRLKVTNLENGRSIVVRINDRGPFVGTRILDLSFKAGKTLGMVENGTVPVKLEALGYGQPRRSKKITSKPADRFTVQVGVFKNLKNARYQAKSLDDGRVLRFNQSGQKLYRVVTGAYNNFELALKRMDSLKQRGRSGAFIIAEP